MRSRSARWARTSGSRESSKSLIDNSKRLAQAAPGAEVTRCRGHRRPRDPGVGEEAARSLVHGDERPVAARGRPAAAAGAGGRAEDLLERKGARRRGVLDARAVPVSGVLLCASEAVARRAHQAWAALSRAAHFHPVRAAADAGRAAGVGRVGAGGGGGDRAGLALTGVLESSGSLPNVDNCVSYRMEGVCGGKGTKEEKGGEGISEGWGGGKGEGVGEGERIFERR